MMHALSHADNDYDQNDLNDDCGPEFTERHLTDEFTKSRVNFWQAKLCVVEFASKVFNDLSLLPDFLLKVLILVL